MCCFQLFHLISECFDQYLAISGPCVGDLLFPLDDASIVGQLAPERSKIVVQEYRRVTMLFVVGFKRRSRLENLVTKTLTTKPDDDWPGMTLPVLPLLDTAESVASHQLVLLDGRCHADLVIKDVQYQLVSALTWISLLRDTSDVQVRPSAILSALFRPALRAECRRGRSQS